MKTRIDKGKFKVDLTGKVFGQLTVIKFDSWVKQGQNTGVSKWLCKCKCGKEVSVKTAHLNRGDTRSCGCLKPNKLKEGESSFNSIYNGYRRHALNRKYDWNLNKEQVFEIFKRNCFYCNKPPSNYFKGNRLNGPIIYNGIDRVDNTMGYNLENTVACCKLCNRLKSDMKLEEFLIHLENICQHMNKSR